MQEASCGLDKCFLCRHCLPDWKQLVVLKKRTFLYKKGKQIFKEGEPVNGMYFINDGSVKVTKNWGEQKELIVRFAKSGDVLGHRGFGADLYYPISATVLEDTKVCFVDNAFLNVCLTTNTQLSFQFVQLYATELHKAEKRMRDLAHMDVKGRIVLALFDIADVFGVTDNGFVEAPVTRQDIASYAGTTYETVFKFFTELTSNGILGIAGKRFRINDRKKLVSFLKE